MCCDAACDNAFGGGGVPSTAFVVVLLTAAHFVALSKDQRIVRNSRCAVSYRQLSSTKRHTTPGTTALPLLGYRQPLSLRVFPWPASLFFENVPRIVERGGGLERRARASAWRSSRRLTAPRLQSLFAWLSAVISSPLTMRNLRFPVSATSRPLYRIVQRYS